MLRPGNGGRVVLLVACALGSLGCGTSGSPGSPAAASCRSSSGGGWITIDAPTELCTYTADSASLSVGGTAFVSPSWWHCCPADPAVTVTWFNDAAAAGGDASSRVEVSALGTVWTHRWSATVPLNRGTNAVTFTAVDPSGRTGTVMLTVNCTAG